MFKHNDQVNFKDKPGILWNVQGELTNKNKLRCWRLETVNKEDGKCKVLLYTVLANPGELIKLS